jgi:hypothetical protein
VRSGRTQGEGGLTCLNFPTSQKKENLMAELQSDPWIGKYVIVRCRDAGVHAGILKSREGRACELSESRRLWRWWAAKGAFLSGVATDGINPAKSNIGAPVDILLTENCEIIACTDKARDTIVQAAAYEPR